MYEEYINKNKGYRECIRNLLPVFLLYIMRQDINRPENAKKGEQYDCIKQKNMYQ